MVVISSTTHKWPQNQIDDQTGLMASIGSTVVEKPSQGEQQQQQQEALRCPRCDSSNTKFCYYNNYSLSQPRHFCKACKRYWTRGGTLRNVPVGGGCRKNKRVKRPASASDASSSSAPIATTNTIIQPQIDLSTTSNHINSLFYGLPTNPSEPNFPYPSFSSRVSNINTVTGYDLQPQLNALGLGFSSGIMATDVQNDDYRNGFNPTKQIQDFTTSSPFLSVLGSSSTSTAPTMASLLASGVVQQQKFISNGLKDIRLADTFQGMVSYEHTQMPVSSDGSMAMKQVKMGEGQNSGLEMHVPIPNQIHQMGSSDFPLLWTPSNASGWIDPTTTGSVLSLI